MLTGTLSDISLHELAGLLQQQSQTGTLTLDLGDGDTVQIMFRDGLIAAVDDSRRPAAMTIGELLVAGELVTRSDVAAALEEQRTSAKPLGAILVGMGVLALNDLARYLDLQFRESLYPLYQVTEGTFAFDTEKYTARVCAPPPIEVEDIAFEAVRRIDELPEVLLSVPSAARRFRRSGENPALPEVDAHGEPYEQRERLIYSAIRDRANTTILVGRTCLSSFDVMKGLANLLTRGAVVPAEALSQSGVRAAVERARQSLFQHRPNLFRPLISALVAVMATVTVLGLWGNGARGADALETGLPAFDSGVRRFDAPLSPIAQFDIELQLEALRDAVEVFALRHGDYPPNLDALVETRLLTPEALQRPEYQRPFYYRIDSASGYVLLPPIR
jgi:hypothetical protein